MPDRVKDTDLGIAEGTCKFFNAVKGFGFITLTDNRDVFFHYTGIAPNQDAQAVREKVPVTCRLWKQTGDHAKGNGLKATEVRVSA